MVESALKVFKDDGWLELFGLPKDEAWFPSRSGYAFLAIECDLWEDTC